MKLRFRDPEVGVLALTFMMERIISWGEKSFEGLGILGGSLLSHTQGLGFIVIKIILVSIYSSTMPGQL